MRNVDQCPAIHSRLGVRVPSPALCDVSRHLPTVSRDITGDWLHDASSLTRANTASRRHFRPRPTDSPHFRPTTRDPRSSAAATRDSRLRRPKYTSCVIDTREWPSWSAIMRAVAPASSNTVAVVFRQAWKVIHSAKPCRSRASTSHRVTVRGSRNVPFYRAEERFIRAYADRTPLFQQDHTPLRKL